MLLMHTQQSFPIILMRNYINKGVGGEVFFPELIMGKDEYNPDCVIVAYGTNDWKRRNKEQFTKNCNEFFNKLVNKYSRAKIFAITPIWRKNHNEDR